jgi:hypothetical protein
MIVFVHGRGLARRAEVGVRTNGALVTNALNASTIPPIFLANRAITIDTVVRYSIEHLERALRPDRLVIQDGHETMSWMCLARRTDAVIAVVPIGAVNTLVANSKDRFITTITECSVIGVSTFSKKCLILRFQGHGFVRTNKLMTWVMPMLSSLQTSNAQVKVLAVLAYDAIRISVPYWLSTCEEKRIRLGENVHPTQQLQIRGSVGSGDCRFSKV